MAGDQVTALHSAGGGHRAFRLIALESHFVNFILSHQFVGIIAYEYVS